MLLQCFTVFVDEIPFLAYIFAGMFGYEEADAVLGNAITVADGSKVKIYMKNFG